MSTDDPTPTEAHCADWLAAYDQALAAGRPPVGEPAAPPELCARLERDAAVLHLLEAVWPRHTPPAPPTGPAQLGRFRLERELGRGGMGVVFLAHDPRLGRAVALKVSRSDALLDPEGRQRFLREGRAAAALDHPNVVPVYEAGEADGVCYIASAYCPGGTLAEWLGQRRQPVPPRDAAALTMALAWAVQHAHSRGVLHRDLKPGNVLLERDRPGDGLAFVPRVTDFGLAKLTAGAATSVCTQTGAVLGTPSYMAPEQAAADTQAVGPATDVYALGAILYELLTGRPPFLARTALDVLVQVRQQEPRPPRLLNPRVDRGLEAICLKCLEKDPRHRYGSAQALGDDLRNWLAGEPIRARTRSWVRWGRRVLRQRPLVLAAALGVVVAVVLVVVLWGRLSETLESVVQQVHWQAIQHQLAEGRSVTLIDSSGGPVHYRWRSGGPTANVALTDDGFFSIHHLEYGLLELLPDPQMERYRFRAEVRHDQGEAFEGEVGIYFLHSEQATAGGRAHCYAAVAFNDREDRRSLGLTGNAVGLWLRQQPPQGFQRPSAFVGDPKSTAKFPFPFPAPGQKPWRQLAVEVTPERVRVLCGGECITDASRDLLLEQAAELKEIAPDPLVDPPAFSPRGGLGLYVSQGAASYRSVVIEPLP